MEAWPRLACRLILLTSLAGSYCCKGLLSTPDSKRSLPHPQSWTPAVWKAALSDLPIETKTPISLPITGTVPKDLVGILYKNGPAKFARNGQPYAHWLEGDGAVIRLEFCQSATSDTASSVLFSSRFVQTKSFQADEAANAVTVRGTFGTKKSDGTENALDIRLKHPANTNAVRLGDHVLALAEVGLPYRLDANTLETLVDEEGGSLETFQSRFREGTTSATVGNRLVDNLLGFGTAVAAHARYAPFQKDLNDKEQRLLPNLVMAGIQQHALTGDTEVTLLELNPRTGQVLGDMKKVAILRDTGFPPHDFVCTLRRAAWITCPAQGNLIPYIMGQRGPAECLSFRPGATSSLHIVDRCVNEPQDLSRAATTPTVKRYTLPEPVHPIHYGCAWERDDRGGMEIYLSGWDSASMENMMESKESMLGSWSSILEGDFSDVQTQPLLKVTLKNEDEKVSSHDRVIVEQVAKDSIEHIDFLKCHPNFEGRQCQYLYGVVSTPPEKGNPSGIGPPQTICIVDLVEERVVDSWFAGTNNILDDFILVPKEGNGDERSAWIIAPCFQGESTSTSFVVLDANDLAKGPVCEAHLPHHIPWALHGTWWSP